MLTAFHLDIILFNLVTYFVTIFKKYSILRVTNSKKLIFKK